MTESNKEQAEDWDPEAAQAKMNRIGLKMPVAFKRSDVDEPGMNMEVQEPRESEIELTKPLIVHRPRNKSALF